MRRHTPKVARRTLLLIVTALAGVALAAVVATAASNQSDDTTETSSGASPPASSAPPKASGVDPALRGRIKLLRDQASASRSGDVPPRVAQPIEEEHGGRVDLAHSETVDGQRLSVVPTTDGACLTDTKVTTCGPTDSVLKGNLSAVLLCGEGLPAGSLRVLGMLPDGIDSVSFQRAGEKSTTTPVTGNIYNATVAGAPTTASWQDPDGKPQTAVLPLPPDYQSRLRRCEP